MSQLGIERLRALSSTDFAALGVNDIAFVKAVTVEGKLAYGIHAADGTPMAVADNPEVAFAAIVQHNLQPVRVH